ncbi:MAG: hypothetical protein AB7N24_11145 [Dehalococcoidia bacterium]
MSSSSLLNPRKPMVWIIGVAAAAAFFASGALVARATFDSDNDPTPDGTHVTVPGLAQEGNGGTASAPASYGADDVKDAGGRGAAMTYPACRTPIPAGIVSGNGIDLGAAGFVPAFPGPGFSALNLSISSGSECDKNGNPVKGALSFDTSWVHDASGIEAYISQRQSSDPVANVIRADSATFWANGYVFNVSVNSYRYLEGDLTPPSGAGASSASGATDAVAPSTAPRIPEVDPRATEILNQIIAQLSPSTDLACFWASGPGDWSDLAAMGIGDPRSAIPAGYDQQDFTVTAFDAPTGAGCDTSVKPTEGFSFNAGWQKDGGDYSYINVAVYSNGYSEDYPGQFSQYGANWSHNGLQFSVYAKAEKPVGTDLIRSLAKALDPNFNEACFIQERLLTDADLAGLGFSPAKAPDGFKLTSSNLVATEIAPGCDKPEGFESSYNLNWTFEGGADTINAGANRYGTSQTGDGSGYKSENNFNWTSANGTNYYVNGYSRGISPKVSEDALVAVAKSMDPNFDLSKLQEGPDGIEKPLPLPADDKAR